MFLRTFKSSLAVGLLLFGTVLAAHGSLITSTPANPYLGGDLSGPLIAYPSGHTLSGLHLSPLGPATTVGPNESIPVRLDSFFDVFVEISLGDMLVGGLNPSGSPGVYNTEILSMNLVSVGGPPTMIRESPTLPSLGQTTITDVGGGLFKIDSFFDVFTELSLDGGATWIPSQGPTHLSLNSVPDGGSTFWLLLVAFVWFVRSRSRKVSLAA